MIIFNLRIAGTSIRIISEIILLKASFRNYIDKQLLQQVDGYGSLSNVREMSGFFLGTDSIVS